MDRPSLLDPRNRWTAALLIAVAILLGVLSIKRAVNGNADFSGNYRHWRANLEKPTLPERGTGLQNQDPDAYPPITYALYAPLGALPLWAAATVWYLINLGCSVYLWREARNWLLMEVGTAADAAINLQMNSGWQVRWGPHRILNMAVIAVLPAWIGSLLLGQNMLPLMALTWSAFQLARRHHPWLAGSMLALATTIKVFPAVFLLSFILTRNYKVVVAYSIAGIFLVGGLGSVYFGPSTNLEFHRKWLKFAVQGPENRPPDPHDPNTLRGSLRYHNQSIEAVSARLLMDVPIHNQPGAPRVNVLHVSAATWRPIRSAATVVCLILGVIVLYRTTRSGGLMDVPRPAAGSIGATSVETYAILSLLQLFVSPIVWSHYYLWLFWPLLLLLVETRRGRRGGLVIYVAWLVGMPLMAVPEVRAIGLHMWLTIVIFVWICWPRVKPAKATAS
ncbi:MAG: hypothetical protein JWN70_6298 [Planctomycetaceae bacterium]|nr:hypothetical protein [Planctomycetaceae bacterium]